MGVSELFSANFIAYGFPPSSSSLELYLQKRSFSSGRSPHLTLSFFLHSSFRAIKHPKTKCWNFRCFKDAHSWLGGRHSRVVVQGVLLESSSALLNTTVDENGSTTLVLNRPWWSSGQRARLLLWWSEFESHLGLLFPNFLLKIMKINNDNGIGPFL